MFVSKFPYPSCPNLRMDELNYYKADKFCMCYIWNYKKRKWTLHCYCKPILGRGNIQFPLATLLPYPQSFLDLGQRFCAPSFQMVCLFQVLNVVYTII
jgi:hypothetical protein